MPVSRSRGFTLTEILVVVGIASILAMVAIPSYQDQVRKSRRSDAKQSLETVAHRLERCYTQLRRFDSLECDQVDAGPTVDTQSQEGHYAIASLDPNGGETLTPQSFTLFATPQGAQVGDRVCARFELDHSSLHRAFDADGNLTTDRCW
jgi:type IV pilus assembly protein PilE